MTIGAIIALTGAMLAIAIVPGPSDFLVVARSITAGFTHGAAVALGVIAADYVLIAASILSLGFIAAEFGALFIIVKFAFGFYLVLLGIATIRARNEPDMRSSAQVGSWITSLSSGFLVTLGDPKAILFYMGFLPAFVDMANATWRDAVIVMVAATVTIAAVKLSYAYLSGCAKALLETARARAAMQAIGGSVLAGTGVFLLFKA